MIKLGKNHIQILLRSKHIRYLEHCGPNDDTNLGYRSLKEVEKWKKKDPLIFAENYLVKKIYLKEKN